MKKKELRELKRMWMDRYVTLFNQVELEQRIVKATIPDSVMEILKGWAKEADDEYSIEDR